VSNRLEGQQDGTERKENRMNKARQKMQDDLAFLYGPETATAIWPQFTAALDAFQRQHPSLAHATVAPDQRLTAQDVVLITYGDQIQTPGEPPLRTLDATLSKLLGDSINTVHILPFYPYSSDDGFSVIDYKQVNPTWGDWDDVQRLGRRFRLMFDGVINHISQHSAWFDAFKSGEAPYTNFFVVADPRLDLSAVVRPRTLPLLTPVDTVDGVKHVWTTFSADQIDLNYAEPQLLLAILDVLLFYVSQGARLIRLDAIGFMWKEPGTSCIHLPQTHRIIQLLRAALDEVAPDVILVTETNVPHAENISYFGDGYAEAQMVYNFTLPPLTLYTFMTGDATHLSTWAATLRAPSPQTTFFNFMASHDGVGLRPLEGILPRAAMQQMAARVLAHGGRVNYRATPDGGQTPYELNIVYFDALNDPEADEAQATQVARFMASQAILLSLPGVPGIYVHSLLGSRNWRAGVAQTGQNRTINRRKFQRDELLAQLADPASIPHQVFARYLHLIRARTTAPAFHPNGAMQVLDLGTALFAHVRTAPDGAQRVLCIHNVTAAAQTMTVDCAAAGFTAGGTLTDLVAGDTVTLDAQARVELQLPAYGVRWLGQTPR
jgi:glycosidase